MLFQKGVVEEILHGASLACGELNDHTVWRSGGGGLLTIRGLF